MTAETLRKYIKNHSRVENIRDTGSRITTVFKVIYGNDLSRIGILSLSGFLLLAIVGPFIAPNDANTRVTDESGWVTNAGPTVAHPLGTNSNGYSIFAQLIEGAQVAFVVGVATALIIGVLGTTVGLVAGYYGGRLGSLLMRIVDVTYGLPFIPFAIIVIIILGPGLWTVVLVISIVFWRDIARVIRSEVVSVKEREMIDAARMSGASDIRIMYYHILPVVLPIALLYSVFGIGWSIIAEAGLSFLGLGADDTFSWGRMLNDAYTSQALREGYIMWMFAPGICIVLFVMSWYFVAEGAEEVVNPELRGRR